MGQQGKTAPDHHREPVSFSYATGEDLHLVHDVVVAAAATAPAGQFFVNELATLARQMGSGFTLLARVGEREAGVLHVHFPTTAEDSYATRAGDPVPCAQVANVDTAAVLPAFRGRGLMAALLGRAEEHLRQFEPDRVAWYATVHPDNTASRRSFERVGYVPVARVRTHGTLDRLVVRKLAT